MKCTFRYELYKHRNALRRYFYPILNRYCAAEILPASGTPSLRYYQQQSIESVLALVGCVYQPV